MKKIKQLLKNKGHEIYHISPDATVYEAVEMLSNKGVGALLVMTGEKLVGLLSERDYARKVILQGKSSRECKVEEIMSTKVLCIPPDAPVEEAMAVMTERRIRHLPVVDSGTVIGVISIGDVVKAIISEHEFHIEQLEKYIMTG
jgi:CBS domain-containing protein